MGEVPIEMRVAMAVEPFLRKRSALFPLIVLGVAAVSLLGVEGDAAAQSAPSASKPKPYQGPLDTIMSTHLWTEVPETKDFVSATHPDTKTLQYQPLTSQTGPDPVRPKLRDAAGIAALQAELEGDVKANARRAGGSGVLKSAKAAKHRAKPAPATASTAK